MAKLGNRSNIENEAKVLAIKKLFECQEKEYKISSLDYDTFMDIYSNSGVDFFCYHTYTKPKKNIFPDRFDYDHMKSHLLFEKREIERILNASSNNLSWIQKEMQGI